MAGGVDIGFGSLIGGVFIVLSLYLQLFDGRWEQGEGKGKEEVENKTIWEMGILKNVKKIS